MLRGNFDRRTVDVRSVRRPTEPDVTARRRSQTGRDRPSEGSGCGRKRTTLAIPKKSPRGRSPPSMRLREQLEPRPRSPEPPTSHRDDRSRPTNRISDRPEARPLAQEPQKSPRDGSRPFAKMRGQFESRPFALEPPKSTPDGSRPPAKIRKRPKSATVTKSICDRSRPPAARRDSQSAAARVPIECEHLARWEPEKEAAKSCSAPIWTAGM